MPYLRADRLSKGVQPQPDRHATWLWVQQRAAILAPRPSSDQRGPRRLAPLYFALIQSSIPAKVSGQSVDVVVQS